jgi:hypothetical protein
MNSILIKLLDTPYNGFRDFMIMIFILGILWIIFTIMRDPLNSDDESNSNNHYRDKTKNAGYELISSSKYLLLSILVVIAIIAIDFGTIEGFSDKDLSSGNNNDFKKGLNVLYFINVFGGLLILILQYLAYLSIKKAGHELIK